MDATEGGEPALVWTRPDPVAGALVLTDDEAARLAAFNTQLHLVYREETDTVTRHDVLRAYVTIKQSVARRAERFGIANNRIFSTRAPHFLHIPYSCRSIRSSASSSSFTSRSSRLYS